MANSNQVLIVVDRAGAISVDAEKQVLVYEVIKHFTQRWQEQARADAAAGETPNVLKYVHTMLKKLSIEHTLVPVGYSVDIVYGMELPAQDVASTETDAPDALPQDPQSFDANSQAPDGYQGNYPTN